MNTEQKKDAKLVLSDWKNYGTLDYVSCWYKKAADFINNTLIHCAYVSTNQYVRVNKLQIYGNHFLKQV